MPEKKHNFTATEIKAGALVLTSIACLVVFVGVIQGLIQPGKGDNLYYATFTNTLGLRQNADIRFAGMLAGRVVEILPNPENKTEIIVTASLNEGIPINQKSVATIEQLSLTAERHLEITSGEVTADPLPPDSHITSKTKSGAFLDIPDLSGVLDDSEGLLSDLRGMIGYQEEKELVASGAKEETPTVMAMIDDLKTLVGTDTYQETTGVPESEMPTATRLIDDLQDFIGMDEAQAKEAAGEAEAIVLTDITSSVDDMMNTLEPELKELMDGLEPVAQKTDKLLGELNSLLDENKDDLTAIVDDVEQITSDISAELETLMADLRGVLENANKMTSEAGALITDNRPVLEDMIGDLGVMVRNLNNFVNTLKTQPQSVVWGKPVEGRKEK